MVAQLMGGYHDGTDPIGRRHFGHRQRLVPTGRTVVQTGEQMAMDIDERFQVVHRGLTSPCPAQLRTTREEGGR